MRKIPTSGDASQRWGLIFILNLVSALATGIVPPKANPEEPTEKGSGNAFNGVAKRMELWIDGKKVGQNLEDQLRVTTSLSRKAHTAAFVVVDSFEGVVSNSVSFTSSY